MNHVGVLSLYLNILFYFRHQQNSSIQQSLYYEVRHTRDRWIFVSLGAKDDIGDDSIYTYRCLQVYGNNFPPVVDIFSVLSLGVYDFTS